MNDQQLSIEQAMALAKKHTREGQLATAKDIYQRILARFPDHKPAQRALSKLPAAKQDKQHFRAQMEHLMTLYASGNAEEGLAAARKLSKKYKDQPMPLNVQGAILTNTGQLEEAVRCFRKALDIDSRYPDAWNNLGSTLSKLGNRAESRSCFQRALGLNPNDPEALQNLAACMREDGDLQKAIALFERSIDLRPSSASAQCGLGITLRIVGRANQSLPYFRNALDIDPQYSEAYLEFGEALLQMKLFRAALENLEKAAQLDPASSYKQYRLGFARFNAGDTEGAIKAYEQSLAISPDTDGVQHFLNIARGETSATAPPGYIKSLFDDYAARFEQSLVDTLGYHGPKVLVELLNENIAPRRYSHAVDLGCGTGLFGELLRDMTDRMTGVDLSSEMLRKAGEKKIYDELIEEDLVSALARIDGQPDFFGAADVLIYIGDLLPVMKAIANAAASGAIIAISTEVLQEDGEIKLLPSGRYAHSNAYVEKIIDDAGLTLIASKEAPLRMEESQWLTGGYYLIKAP